MKIKTAQRIHSVKEYYFSKKLKEIAERRAAGQNILNLGIGSPDLPPAENVVQALIDNANRADVHGYQSYVGLPELRSAFAKWYAKQYQVSLDPASEILPLIGSKEGIMHISMTYLEPGDTVLIPNPGYPTYSSAAKLAGATIQSYELLEDRNWSPDFETLAQMDLSKVKIMWVNYPHMPTGATGSDALFKKLIEFGKTHEILICHDNPYSFILNEAPKSILSYAGAKDICLELTSLSKSHNMAGWRIGALMGSADKITDILKFKSNMDSGMFRSIQMAAIEALNLGSDWYQKINQIYRERKTIAYQILDALDCTYQSNQAGLFVWGKVAHRYTDGYALSDDVLDQTGIFITPGGIFGSMGQNYIRISICTEKSVLEKALETIHSFTNQNVL